MQSEFASGIGTPALPGSVRRLYWRPSAFRGSPPFLDPLQPAGQGEPQAFGAGGVARELSVSRGCRELPVLSGRLAGAGRLGGDDLEGDLAGLNPAQLARLLLHTVGTLEEADLGHEML